MNHSREDLHNTPEQHRIYVEQQFKDYLEILLKTDPLTIEVVQRVTRLLQLASERINQMGLQDWQKEALNKRLNLLRGTRDEIIDSGKKIVINTYRGSFIGQIQIIINNL